VDQTGTNLKHASVKSAVCLALMSVGSVAGVKDDQTEREVTFKTSDGWQVIGYLHVPQSKHKVPAVLLVHGSRHESDAYGNLTAPGMPRTLSQHGVATLRFDIRGRGASREPRDFNSMAPEERARVALDIEAAIKFLASQQGVDARRIGVVAEQDSTTAAIRTGAKDHRVQAFVLISGRLNQSAKHAIVASSAPILCLVSKEDRRGFQDMTDAFLASKSKRSRIKVFEGLALGTTMFSTWRNEFPRQQPIDEMAATWLADVLKSGSTVRKRKAH